MRKSFIKDGFAQNVSILTVGTTFAQLFPFLLYPLIGRLYTPEQNAVLAAYTSIVAIVQAVSTGKYEYTIFLSDTDEGAANVAVMSFILSIITSVLLLVFSLIVPCFWGFVTSIDLGKLLYLMPISIIGISAFDIYNQWCIRRSFFKRLAINKITNSACVNLSKVGMGYTPINSFGLVIGDVLGRFITMVVCITRIISFDINIFKKITLSGMLFQAKKYVMFPKYSMPAQFLNTLGASLPILLLSKYYDDSYVGLFSMSIAVLYVPISVVGCSIRDVLRKKVRDIKSEKRVRSIFLQIFKKISVLSITAALIGVWVLPWLFSSVLGDKWMMSGVYAQILTPLIVTNFISTCVDATLIVAEKTKQIFYWQVLYLACAIIPIIVGGLFSFPFEKTLLIYTILKMICDIALIVMSYYYACWIDGVK